MAPTFEAARAGYGNLWRAAAVKGGQDDANAELFAGKILAAEDRYKAVQAATGVPWFFVGALHMREASCNFGGVLHNGQQIIGTGQRTTLVPAGRGPFATWEESAIDALKGKGLDDVPSWPIERMLYEAERYNGWGYLGKTNSPYVWAGTTQEQTGKYVADHVWDASADDKQLGVAAVLKRLAEKRPDIAAAMVSAPAPGSSAPIIIPPTSGTQQPAARNPVTAFIEYLLTHREEAHEAMAFAVGAFNAISPGRQFSTQQPPATAPTTTPVTQRPSVQLGLTGLMGSLIGMATGTVGTPFGLGAEPTTTGTLATLIPAAVSLIGATGGGWAGLIGPVLKIVGGLAQSATKK